ncbi:MAG: hypothetical protein J7498_05420 [Sphingobium sp.]|nr:hypothetical protein [Sphingobium sp.]
MNALVPIEQSNVAAYRASTDAAELCKEIVVATATNIQGRKYVCVEGWQAIAVAHGCAASAHSVERVDGGIRAIGQVRRMSDGTVLAEAEGFVGEDETTWFGGEQTTKWGTKNLPKRPDYAIRAMAQTRAISRACRSAFAHVVVMMNANLSTTPAEEVPSGGFEDAQDAEFVEVATKPVAREKMDGPFPTKTALKKAADNFIGDLRKVAELGELEAILSAPSTQALKEQLKRCWPGYLDGRDMPEEFEPIIDMVNRLREEMAVPEAAE